MSRQSSLTSFFGGKNIPEKKMNEPSKKKKIQTKISTTAKRNHKTDCNKEMNGKLKTKKRKIIDDLVDTDDDYSKNEKYDSKKESLLNEESSNVLCSTKSKEKISGKTNTTTAENTNELSKVKIIKEDETVEGLNNDNEFEIIGESESSNEFENDSEASNEDDVKLSELLEEKSKILKNTSEKSQHSIKKEKKPDIKMKDITLDEIPWKENGKVPFSILCETFLAIENISSRLQIQDILTKLFQKALLAAPQDVIVLIYLASNTVAPAYDCVELGIGDSILEKAIGEASGTSTCTFNVTIFASFILFSYSF